jgi:Methyltransferase domain
MWGVTVVARRSLKTLAQRGLRGTAKAWNTPLEFLQGYRYGRNFAASNGSAPEPVLNTWLEDYSDSLTTGPGLWKWQHYLPIYERHLSKFRDKDVHILEIGVMSGGSLRMWKAYFGDKAHVYGVDIEPACHAYEDDRTRIFIGDQSDKSFWQQVVREVPRLDVVIDDGGHRSFQQIATMEALLPHLRPGGVYLCEDVLGPINSFHGYIEGFSRNLHTMGPAGPVGKDMLINTSGLQRSIDSIHLYPFVTVIERRSAQLTQMSAPKLGTEWQPVDTEWEQRVAAAAIRRRTTSRLNPARYFRISARS